MKRTAIAAVALALGSVTVAAHAQNSVTLYGLIDSGIGYVHNADSNSNLTGMINGNLSGDRWGLKGSEDLGGGLKTIFALESGFDVGTGKMGQGTRLFGRQAYVGFQGDKWGTVTLGRQYDPITDTVQGVTADNFFGSTFATPGDVDNNDNSARISNAVKYVSPTYAGFQFEGLYAFSGVAGQAGQGYTYSGAATYTAGALSLAAGYLRATNNSATTARTSWASSTTDSIFDSHINDGYVTAKSVSIAQIGGQYVLGSFTMGASYSNTQLKADASSTFSSTEKYNSGKAFVAYQATPALIAGVGYAYTAASGDTSAHYHQVSIGADYNLSKRTDFYAVAAYQHANGTQRLSDGTTQAAQASIGSYGYNGTSTQEIAIVGIRHKF
ncbi:Outer membrane protein (Porin) [Paraburkholderia sabiae]|jgi:predicted porin|uniref:porin n=1 Tax=Paraburkholderia sabiae TaxID=273251 RepID=UPI001CB59B99|nr:porin [Paraburkholderia sabiae]CAG9210616.1 Outer membrane protein (Porin) [Paraburkholderia sabiae]